jgi:hypothetical protein
VTQLFGAAPVGVPASIDPITFAQKDIYGEATARRGADILAKRAVGSRVPRHLVTHAAFVGECFVKRPLGDDDKPGVVVVQELQPGELRGEASTPRALPFLTRKPHVVVYDQLRLPVEHVDQPHRSVLAVQNVVPHLDHRQPPSLRGDRV